MVPMYYCFCTCWHILASLNLVNIGSGNDLMPVRHQAMTWTNADLLSRRPSGTNLWGTNSKIWNKTWTFNSTKCILSPGKGLVILFRPQCVRSLLTHPPGNAPSQWETTLHCNVISHWPGALKNYPWTSSNINQKNTSYGHYIMGSSLSEQMVILDACHPNKVSLGYSI